MGEDDHFSFFFPVISYDHVNPQAQTYTRIHTDRQRHIDTLVHTYTYKHTHSDHWTIFTTISRATDYYSHYRLGLNPENVAKREDVESLIFCST